LNANQLF